ncbi:hypothetical protein PALB_23100 [Pseudoalteromonas luteoviolacea B = ATCC 29581]|nr:hypothetical protein PALB_23100 [Pseudoalteromonas luteoviolacea B = ATCC 29581]
MSETKYDYHTSAVRRAASGKLTKVDSISNRASVVYGFSNYALKKSREELKDAWSKASLAMRDVKG